MTDTEADDPGVDYAWVMQTTFVVTVVVGAPVVALLSAFQPLPTWGARVEFAVRVGAVVWILVALSVFVYARKTDAGGESDRSGDQEERDHDREHEPPGE